MRGQYVHTSVAGVPVGNSRLRRPSCEEITGVFSGWATQPRTQQPAVVLCVCTPTSEAVRAVSVTNVSAIWTKAACIALGPGSPEGAICSTLPPSLVCSRSRCGSIGESADPGLYCGCRRQDGAGGRSSGGSAACHPRQFCSWSERGPVCGPRTGRQRKGGHPTPVRTPAGRTLP